MHQSFICRLWFRTKPTFFITEQKWNTSGAANLKTKQIWRHNTYRLPLNKWRRSRNCRDSRNNYASPRWKTFSSSSCPRFRRLASHLATPTPFISQRGADVVVCSTPNCTAVQWNCVDGANGLVRWTTARGLHHTSSRSPLFYSRWHVLRCH